MLYTACSLHVSVLFTFCLLVAAEVADVKKEKKLIVICASFLLDKYAPMSNVFKILTVWAPRGTGGCDRRRASFARRPQIPSRPFSRCCLRARFFCKNFIKCPGVVLAAMIKEINDAQPRTLKRGQRPEVASLAFHLCFYVFCVLTMGIVVLQVFQPPFFFLL